MMPRPAVRVTAVITLLLLLGACGSGRSSDDGATSTSQATRTDTSVPQFGDLESPCGPGDPSGSPDQAVTADSITIGFGDDAGYQGSPGIGHEASDAVRALIDWCNEQGGINGRTVVGNYYDAKITEMQNVMTEACTQTFFLVGEFFALPESAEPTRIDCGLPAVPGVVSGAGLAMAPLVVASYPQPVDQFNAGTAALVADAYPDEVRKAVTMLPIFPNLQSYEQRFVRTAPAVGWEFLDCAQTYPITGVADFRPYLQKLKDCGAEVVFTLDLRGSLENIFDAAAQLDYHPVWVNAASAYTQDLAAWNTNGNGDRLYFGNSFVPLGHTPEGSANATYVKLVTESGGDVAYAGQVSASSFLLWATAAEACGNELTRACVMENLKSTHEWDAGGLSTVQDPGGNRIDSCVALMNLSGTAFVAYDPSEPGQFACDPSWAMTVDPLPDAGVALQLGPDRIATKTAG